MEKNTFLLYACDAWKMRNSMRLIVATKSVTRLKKVIKDAVAQGVIDYNNGSTCSQKKALCELDRLDIVTERSRLNSQLNYGFVDCVNS